MLQARLHHRFTSGFELDVDLTAPPGVTALVGPSGAGKTTILNILAGFLQPQVAQVSLSDQRLIDTTGGINVPPEHRSVGFVPQDDLLFPHMTVLRNLRYGARHSSGQQDDFSRILSVLELEPLIDRLPETLSGGQCQRVALGRALLRGPKILLMDEPVNAQHESLKQRVMDDLRQIIDERGIIAIFVSHDQESVRRIAQKTIQLTNGRDVKRLVD